jgi:hypothetical protein
LQRKASGPTFNPSNAELNSICHLLALLGAHPIFHVSRIRVNTNNDPLHHTNQANMAQLFLVIDGKCTSGIIVKNLKGKRD